MNCFQNNICKKEAQLTYEHHTVCSPGETPAAITTKMSNSVWDGPRTLQNFSQIHSAVSEEMHSKYIDRHRQTANLIFPRHHWRQLISLKVYFS